MIKFVYLYLLQYIINFEKLYDENARSNLDKFLFKKEKNKLILPIIDDCNHTNGICPTSVDICS